jgi:hypothetical protein
MIALTEFVNAKANISPAPARCRTDDTAQNGSTIRASFTSPMPVGGGQAPLGPLRGTGIYQDIVLKLSMTMLSRHAERTAWSSAHPAEIGGHNHFLCFRIDEVEPIDVVQLFTFEVERLFVLDVANLASGLAGMNCVANHLTLLTATPALPAPILLRLALHGLVLPVF